MYFRLDSIWKDTFILLFNNKETKLHPMWEQFKNGILSNHDIQTVVESNDGLFKNEVKNKLSDLTTNINSCQDLLEELRKDSSLFTDEFWKILLILLRDRETRSIDKDKTLPIVEGGQVKFMTSEELEEKFMEDYPHLLASQISIPDQLMHEDQMRIR